jgi:hypothetical protein
MLGSMRWLALLLAVGLVAACETSSRAEPLNLDPIPVPDRLESDMAAYLLNSFGPVGKSSPGPRISPEQAHLIAAKNVVEVLTGNGIHAPLHGPIALLRRIYLADQGQTVWLVVYPAPDGLPCMLIDRNLEPQPGPCPNAIVAMVDDQTGQFGGTDTLPFTPP